MSTYLVTGGAGFIGSSIAEELLSRGERVRILDDFSTGRRANLESMKGRIEIIEGSVVNPEAVGRAVSGVDVIFHEAAIPSVARSVDNPAATLLANVQGTTVLLDGARHAGVRRVIFAASSSAYGDTPTLPKVETMAPTPLSPYAVSKLACEHMMRVAASLYGIETLCLRYFNVFGARQDPAGDYSAVIPRFITTLIDGGRPKIYGDGEQTRDFCYIDNVVGANLLGAAAAGRLSGQVINIACGATITLNELLATLVEEGKRLGAIPQSRVVEAEHLAPRAGDVRASLADISAARALIGYEPRVLVAEGLQRTFAAFYAMSHAARVHRAQEPIPAMTTQMG